MAATLTVVLKLSKFCNMRCTYCFEFDDLDKRERIAPDALTRLFLSVRSYAERFERIERILFVMHGGEPLTLPQTYYADYFERQQNAFSGSKIKVQNTIQTNLLSLDEEKIRLIEKHGVHIGVSHDGAGEARVNMAGRQVADRVADNMDRLTEMGVPYKGIAVLHRGNLERVEEMFRFYYDRGIDFRVLSILSFGEPQGQRHGLGITQAERLEALKRIADIYFASPPRIRLDPIDNFLRSAVDALTGRYELDYQPETQGEWALIVDTDGSTYTYGDSYTPEGYIGNLVTQSIPEIFESQTYLRASARRKARMAPCNDCPFFGSCDQTILAEAAPSERVTDAKSNPVCPVAQPMIAHLCNLIGEQYGASAKSIATQ